MELQQVVQSLKTFSDSISNDLRTPIWRLNGYCQVLEDSIEEEAEASGVVHQIRKDGQRITQFINDAFRLSSITRSEVNREQVDLSQIAGEILSELQVEKGQRSIEYQIEDEIIVNADQRLVLIMMRLLLYYVWFYSQVCMGERISLETAEKEEGTVCLRISGDNLERITNNELFVPLYQAYLIKDYFQTGLSLVTVQRVMSLHGGRIWIDRSDDRLELFFTFK
jgi:signal transduction histidine kinase